MLTKEGRLSPTPYILTVAIALSCQQGLTLLPLAWPCLRVIKWSGGETGRRNSLQGPPARRAPRVPFALLPRARCDQLLGRLALCLCPSSSSAVLSLNLPPSHSLPSVVSLLTNIRPGRLQPLLASPPSKPDSGRLSFSPPAS